jgi:2',3'-cyclic-nucleotide 2'-phosphodiesterase (5'-nucleotidase family)
MRLLEPIARITIPLTKAQPESTLGNLVADAALTAARQEDPKVSAAIIPFYTLGQSYIAPGTLTRKNCYDILPYENRLLIVELTGAQIRILCDSIARQKGWPISGLTFVIDSGSSKQHQINGAAIHDQLLYKIVVTEYVVSDRIAAAFRLNTGRHYLARSLRSALIAYLQERQQPDHVLQVLLENRIQYAD